MVENLTCNEHLKQHLQSNLKKFEAKSQQTSGLKRAAVAITVVNVAQNPRIYDLPYQEAWAMDAALLLTRRTSKLREHAGQWAFPGGRMDADETPEQTAMRELEEEVGLQLNSQAILGHLDDFTTRSGYVIKPVVFWGGSNVTLQSNPQEVASIHRIPLLEFLREDAPIFEKIPESKHPVLKMPLGNSWIATPTGAMIFQFREVALRGNPIRVAHFEAPYFAWK